MPFSMRKAIPDFINLINYRIKLIRHTKILRNNQFGLEWYKAPSIKILSTSGFA